MQIIHHIDAMSALGAQWRAAGETSAFVPTMGNLHEGHLSLVRQARGLAEHVVVSIFVNPLQFDRAADLDAYPRTLEDDLAALRAEGVDAVFVPDEAEMYPRGREAEPVLEVPGLEALMSTLEGERRPGHFPGVVTVVKKLFDIVAPDVAVFGEKDFQQLRVIQAMVAALGLPVRIVAGETRREDDGLAMSSRNNYLGEAERARAGTLYATLEGLRGRIRGAAPAAYPALCAEAEQALAAAGFRPEYVVVRRGADLAPPGEGDDDLRILAAAWLGPARLIDNIKV